MEARYLRDLLQRVLRQLVFLDSQNLSSLDHLFTRGIMRSDTLILLATKDVFTRPYCLLEMWCAQRAGVPIVVFEIARRRFEWADAKRICADVETLLDPEAVALIKATLRSVLAEIGDEGEEPPSLIEFGRQIGHALCVEARLQEEERRKRTSHRTGLTDLTEESLASLPTEARQATFHPWGTDSGIIADVCCYAR